jgi:transcriptional regulator with XRE-family HTH domain
MKRAQRLLPNLLRLYRLKYGYEQMEVARLLGLKSHARISEWEHGTSKPGLENLFKLSIVYQTMPDELYCDLRLELVKELEERKKKLLAGSEVGG